MAPATTKSPSKDVESTSKESTPTPGRSTPVSSRASRPPLALAAAPPTQAQNKRRRSRESTKSSKRRNILSRDSIAAASRAAWATFVTAFQFMHSLVIAPKGKDAQQQPRLCWILDPVTLSWAERLMPEDYSKQGSHVHGSASSELGVVRRGRMDPIHVGSFMSSGTNPGWESVPAYPWPLRDDRHKLFAVELCVNQATKRPVALVQFSVRRNYGSLSANQYDFGAQEWVQGGPSLLAGRDRIMKLAKASTVNFNNTIFLLLTTAGRYKVIAYCFACKLFTVVVDWRGSVAFTKCRWENTMLSFHPELMTVKPGSGSGPGGEPMCKTKVFADCSISEGLRITTAHYTTSRTVNSRILTLKYDQGDDKWIVDDAGASKAEQEKAQQQIADVVCKSEDPEEDIKQGRVRYRMAPVGGGTGAIYVAAYDTKLGCSEVGIYSPRSKTYVPVATPTYPAAEHATKLTFWRDFSFHSFLPNSRT